LLRTPIRIRRRRVAGGIDPKKKGLLLKAALFVYPGNRTSIPDFPMNAVRLPVLLRICAA
jgi:hypothetical protein